MMVSVNKADASAGSAVPLAAMCSVTSRSAVSHSLQTCPALAGSVKALGSCISLHICVSESQHQKDPNLVSCVSGSNQDQGSW